MINYTGEIVRIPSSNAKGPSLINDHVSFQLNPGLGLSNKAYSVYARIGYAERKGEDEYLFKMSESGWGSIDIICEHSTLDDAMRAAKAEAENRGVVLLLDEFSKVNIKWHPEGWQPQYI